MPGDAPIDDAFDRYRVLSMLIDMESKRARANPLDGRYIGLGITTGGDTKRDASQKLDETFDALAMLVQHVAILDMTGSLERVFRMKIADAAGAARNLIKRELSRGDVRSLATKLVRDSTDFESLGELQGLIAHSLSPEVAGALKLIRSSRNRFAHGAADLKVPSTVEPEVARVSLNAVAALL